MSFKERVEKQNICFEELQTFLDRQTDKILQ